MDIPERLSSLRAEMEKGGNRSKTPVHRLTLEQAGASTTRKLGMIRAKMYEYGATHHIITMPDEVSWIFNIFTGDIEHMEAVLSYAAIETENVYLFIDKERLSTELQAELMDTGVVLMPYDGILAYVHKLADTVKVLIDPNRMNAALYQEIPSGVTRIEKEDPAAVIKSK